MQQYQGGLPDEGLHVEFYNGSIKDDVASEASEKQGGPPVFKEVPFVRIAIPGNRDEVIDTIAWLDEAQQHSHINRFPNAWARFKAKESGEAVSGFPLKEWAGVTRAAVDTLAYLRVKTVEQLASLSDANLQRVPLPNPPELRARAQAFLAQRNSGESMRAELEALRAQMANLQAQGPNVSVIPQAASAQVLGPQEAEEAAPEAQEASPVRRRGRPAKSQQPQP